MADLEVRLLGSEDAEAYVALRREMLTDTPWSFLATIEDDVACEPEGLRARISQDQNDIAGAFDGTTGDLVAVAGVIRMQRAKVRHRAGVWGVYTTPAARGRGAARAVMTLAVDTARSWDGVRWIGLSVSDEAPAALGLYESMGFELWGTEPVAMVVEGRDHAELHMALEL